jgi:hypothetical protein
MKGLYGGGSAARFHVYLRNLTKGVDFAPLLRRTEGAILLFNFFAGLAYFVQRGR